MATMHSAAGVFTALENLPPFPPVACKALTLLRRENVPFGEVGDVLKTDAALSAEVLRLANSASGGARYRVNSILQALALVGVQRVASLLVTLSLSKMIRRAGAAKTIRNSWRHSLATALAAKEFASSFGSEPEEAYLAGLFHDLGRLALLVLEPGLYDQIISQDGDVRELEWAHFGMDHCEAGAWLIEKWKLPRIFANVARYHHDPKLDANNLTMVVQASCIFADEIGFSLRPPPAGPDVSEKLGFFIAATINSLECEYDI
jgi:putative nucleotidyltransferase with HDIG domain